jgi:hypothetical protein
VYGDDNGNGRADYEEGDGNMNAPNVHVPHANLPDGALTGGFCRHHRWC